MERKPYQHEIYHKALCMTLIERVRETIHPTYDELLENSQRLEEFYNLLTPGGQVIVDQVIELMCGHKLSALADPDTMSIIMDRMREAERQSWLMSFGYSALGEDEPEKEEQETLKEE